jgi:hypothetical protein
VPEEAAAAVVMENPAGLAVAAMAAEVVIQAPDQPTPVAAAAGLATTQIMGLLAALA